jgi:hypothetical protein
MAPVKRAFCVLGSMLNTVHVSVPLFLITSPFHREENKGIEKFNAFTKS